MDFSGLNDLCIPVLACDSEGIVLYKNVLTKKRFSGLAVGHSAFRHICKEDRKAFRLGLQKDEPFIFCIERNGLVADRGLLLPISKDCFILAFFAELQLLLAPHMQASFLDAAPELIKFFSALLSDDSVSSGALNGTEQRLLAAEQYVGAWAALIAKSKVVGQTYFQVFSIFQDLYVDFYERMRHCGAKILFRNYTTADTYRYSRSWFLPISIIKLMLFALLTTPDRRIEVDLAEKWNRQPCFEIRFYSREALPIMLNAENLQAFAACYPKLYPMLFGYLSALFAEDCRISVQVGEDGHMVSLRVSLLCDPEQPMQFESPALEEEILRVLRMILQYSTIPMEEL